MTTVFVGPIGIQLHSALTLTPWLRPFEAYLSTSTPHVLDVQWSLTIHPAEEGSDRQAQTDFSFKRHGLEFTADCEKRTAHLYSNGEEADFLAALELCMYLACHQLGGLSIHGAAGVVNHRGWLMPGPSGTGKSTAARFAGFERIVGDERILLLPSVEKGWQLVSTPFWSRGRTRVPEPYSHALGAIVALEKRGSLHLTQISQAEALESLMRNIVYYGNDPQERDQLLETALDVLSNTEQYRLGFPKDGPWAWTLDQMHSSFSRTRCEPSIFPSTSIGT